MICFCLTGSTMRENYALAEKYEKTADIFELRYDFLVDDCTLEPVAGKFIKPVIFTIRLPEDGGKRPVARDVFRQRYIEAVSAGYSYIDIHVPCNTGQYAWSALIDEIIEKALSREVQVIRSRHFMNDFPENLDQQFIETCEAKGDIPKLAVYPESLAQVLDIFRLADAYPDTGKILIGMGDYGFMTRVLTARLRTLWTYTSASPDRNAAPGHVSPEKLLDTYHYRSLHYDDSIFCVVGNPVMHSRSPEIHNRALRAHNIHAVYVPVMVNSPEEFFRLAEYLDIRCVSVTVPLKEKVIAFCDSVSDDVRFTGACNTLVCENGTWKGSNTDIAGFMKSCMDFLGTDTLAGSRILVIGAGGAARGITYGLKKAGAEVAVMNRTYSKAESLAQELGLTAYELGSKNTDVVRAYPDAIIQTTNAGMLHFENEDPLDWYSFTGAEKVYDIIYNPPETLMLKRAREKGCRTLNGETMLLEQAKLQYSLFTGREYDLEL